MDKETVLVTGASGYIAGHCILRLARAGFRIKGTVRNLERASSLERAYQNAAVDFADEVDVKVDWYQADLESDDGWEDALSGCDRVLHVASPIPRSSFEEPSDYLRPAKEGTLRVLRAASQAGVKRIVVTSSAAAVACNNAGNDALFTEKNWTDPGDQFASSYTRSKTLAELAAWEFMKRDKSGMELSVVNPVLVLGPVLEKDYGTSAGEILRILNAEISGILNIGHSVVDVRDVADLHLLAMTRKEAAGQRFIASDDFLWMGEIVEIIRNHLPEYSRRIPRRKLPNFLLHMMALFNPALRNVTKGLGKRIEFDTSKAKTTLNWHPRTAEESVKATVDSLIKFDLVKFL